MRLFLTIALVVAACAACPAHEPPEATDSEVRAAGVEVAILARPFRSTVDAATPVKITVSVSDRSGLMLEGRRVELVSNMAGDVLTPASGETRPSGVFASTLRGTTPGPRVVTARVGEASDSVAVYLGVRSCDGEILVGGQPPAMISWPQSIRPIALLTGDLDGDGRDDLVLVLSAENPARDERSGRFVVRLRAGEDGQPSESTSFRGGAIRAAALADFDGDGRLDLALESRVWDPTGAFAGRLDLLLGNGDGTFREGPRLDEPYAVDTSLQSVALPGEARARLVRVVRWSWSDPFVVQVLVAGDDGSWSPIASGEFGAGAIQAGDFDGDGRVDLVVADYRVGVEVWMGSEGGTFAISQPPIAGGEVPFAGDLDGDGVADLVVRVDWETYEVWRGAGDGTFSPRGGELSIPSRFEWIGTRDFDGDGSLDLFFAEELETGRALRVFLGDGTGAFTDRFDFGLLPIYDVHAFAMVDLEGDDREELAFAGWNVLTVLPLVAEGTPAQFPAGSFAEPFPLTAVAVHVDGRLSLAVGGLRALTVLQAKEGGHLTPVATLPWNEGFRALAASDFYRDGTDALVSLLQSWRQAPIVVSIPRMTTQAIADSLPYPAAVATVDLDGGGREEIVVATEAGVMTFRVNLDRSYEPGPTVPSSIGVGIAGGDVDGDGHADVVTTGSETILHFGNGAGGFGSIQRLPIEGATVVVADVDWDGKADVVVGRSGSLTVIRSGGNAVSYETGSPSTLMVGDFDGDLVPDVAVAGPGDAVSFLWGVGDGTFSPPVRYPGGGSLVSVLFGDFLGDGSETLALVRADGVVHLAPVTCRAHR